METQQPEKRTCQRFTIPGGAVSVEKSGFLANLRKSSDKSFPLVDISQGGLRFLAEGEVPINTKLHLIVSAPDETDSLHISGLVKWIIPQPESGSVFQVGVQFLPYGVKREENNPSNLLKIEEWKNKFCKQ